MDIAEAVKRIKSVRHSLKTSHIIIQKICTWFIDNYYIVIRFECDRKMYEYREDASSKWIESCA